MEKLDLKELLDLGLHFGHLRSYSHPKAQSFVYTISNGISVIDLEKTKQGLENAIDYVKNLAKDGKVILFIGTKRQAASIIKEKAEKVGTPYIVKRFMGGTLTNFDTVLGNIKKLKSLDEELEIKKKNKKEFSMLSREKTRLNSVLEGLVNLSKLPDALFIVDVVKEKNAVAEANTLGIPVIAIVDTNGDPSKIDYPIPASDDSKKGVEYIVSKVIGAYSGGLKKQKTKEKKEDKK